MIYVGMHGQYISTGKMTNSGNGITGGIGINIARFFTKKMHLGIYGTFKQREFVWPSSINSSFGAALNTNSNLQNLNSADSIMADYFISETNKKGSLGGAGRYQYGATFYLPIRFFPFIKIYKGSTYELINTGEPVKTLTNDPDWIYFHYNTYGAELTLFYDYGKKNNITEKKRDIPFAISLFCEKNTLQNSAVNDVKLRSFLNDSFYSRYNNDWRFGIKVGIEFW